LGSVSVRDQDGFQKMGPVYRQLGLAVSPDDCSLALRGLQTLALRLDQLERSTLQVAQWLSDHPKIETVYHPALPSCPGHDLWKRDFSGSTSVFSILFDDSIAPAQIDNFIDGLALFHIGLSWGGVNSLAVVYPDIDRPGQDYGGRLVRLNIGLEHVEDLIADLENAFRIAL
jgi:cystathionine beta-lyase